MDIVELAGCVILDDYGRLLLLHRYLGNGGQWELPGGNVEDEELPKHAAVRELAEELGVAVAIVSDLGSELLEDDDIAYQFNWFEARISAGQLSIMEPETFDDFDYFELEDLSSLALSANMLVLYPKIMSGEVELSS